MVENILHGIMYMQMDVDVEGNFFLKRNNGICKVIYGALYILGFLKRTAIEWRVSWQPKRGN